MRRVLLVALIAGGATLGIAPAAQGFVYWATGAFIGAGSTIGRANNDGTGKQVDFIGGLGSPCGVAVDGGHIYWGDFNNNSVGRANLDGTNVEPNWIPGGNTPCGVAVDGDFVYWANTNGDTIGRASITGGSPDQNFITGQHLPCGVAVNETHIFWGNSDTNAVGRALINGQSPDPAFIPGGDEPCGVALNSAHVYWANVASVSGNSSIGRANLDGTAPDQGFVPNAGEACGVAVDDTSIFWGNPQFVSIGRSDLSGSNQQNIFIPGASNIGGPCGVASDDGVRTTSTAVSCSPGSVAVSQPSTCTATVTDTHNGLPTAPSGPVNFSSASGGAAFPGGSSCTLSPSGTNQSRCSVTYTSGFGANLVLGFYPGDASHDASTGLGQVVVGSFSLGAITVNNRNGTATLGVYVPGPGSVVLTGPGIQGITVPAAAAGPLTLPIEPTQSTRNRLNKDHQATVDAAVTFTPAGGGAVGSGSTAIVLVQKAKKPKKKKKRRKKKR